jgi:hypothetical protein
MTSSHETIQGDGVTLHIYQQDDAESPREWDNLGTMVCWHTRYSLGDVTVPKNDYANEQEVLLKACGNERDILYLPLYLYDHSGLTMHTTGFHCPWDSGQVGWIYVKREDVRKEYNVKRITDKIKEKVFEVLRSEVETYDQYLQGEIYEYVLEGKNGEVLDSCGGFYGDNPETNGMFEYIPKVHLSKLQKKVVS